MNISDVSFSSFYNIRKLLLRICIFQRDIIKFILFISMTYTLPTDKEISQKLSAALPVCLKDNNNSLSNSVILDSKDGILFIFISNSYKINRSNQFYLIVLNLSLSMQQGVNPHVIPIRLKSQLTFFSEQIFQKTKIQIVKNQYQQGLIAISIKRQNDKKVSQKIYFSKLNVQNLMKKQEIEFGEIGVKQDRFHTFLWHPYVPDTLLVLTRKSLLIFSLQKSFSKQTTEIQFSSIKKTNKIQISRDTQFFNMSFVNVNYRINQNSNPKQGYLSLIRKFQLFLIDRVGRIYLLSPFFCQGIIISDHQSQIIFSQLFQKKGMINNLFINLLNILDLSPIQTEEGEDRQFRLVYAQKQPNKLQISLKQIRSNINENIHFQSRILRDFSVFLVENRTVISSCIFDNKQRCNIINVSVIPIYYQDCMLVQENNMGDINQFAVARILSDQNVDIESQIRFLKPIGNDNLYFLQENKCFKINLQGLANHFKDQSSSRNEIIQVTKLFNAKQSKIIALNNNQDQIMFIRFNKNRFFYDSIAFKGLKIKQNLKKINQQVKNIFENILTVQKKPKVGKDPAFQKVQKVDLSQIQTRLNKFSADYKKDVQVKMSRIKSLYEKIQKARQNAEEHQKVNNQLRNLVKQAQNNDKRIKQLLDQRKKNSSPHFKELLNRIQNVKFLLDKLNDDCRIKIELNPTTLNEFQDQAKGILKKMEQIRQGAQKKIILLKDLKTDYREK